MAFKKHTVLRMYQRRITEEDAKEALNGCKIIEEYPDDYPLPSYLVLGYTKMRRPIHAVVSIDEEGPMLWIITMYEPDLSEWEEGFEEILSKVL
jgi:hypothetical protein